MSSASDLVTVLLVVAMATIVEGTSKRSQCPKNQIIKKIIYKKNRWVVECHKAGRTSSCEEYAYDVFNRPNLFICPMDGLVTGIRNDKDNTRPQRRLIIRCCDVENLKPSDDCATNSYTNDQYLTVPEGAAIKGAYSLYDIDLRERQWKFLVCPTHEFQKEFF